jgi:predicted nucleic acid-binding protein
MESRSAKGSRRRERFTMIAIRFRAYIDTGVLVKLYHLEAGSREATERVRSEPKWPLPFLCEIELRNALRVLCGRGTVTEEALRFSLAALDDDIATGRLARVAPDPAKVATAAEDLSRQHASATLCRALDLLHVAAARVLKIPRFVTGDARQAALADRAGLEVDFLRIEEAAGGVLIRPAPQARNDRLRRALRKVRGSADAGLSTGEILDLTRER